MAEQRYRAVLAVISDGRTVTEVAAAIGVSRQRLHAWLGRYEADGLEVQPTHRTAAQAPALSGDVEGAAANRVLGTRAGSRSRLASGIGRLECRSRRCIAVCAEPA